MPPSSETQIALLIQSSSEIKADISDIKSDIKSIQQQNKNDYVSKTELQLTNDRVKRLETVAGLIGGTILLAVLGALLRLVIIGAK